MPDSPPDPVSAEPRDLARRGDRPVDGASVRLHEEFHRLAARQLERERAWLARPPRATAEEPSDRLRQQRSADWSDAAGFLTEAAVAIRRILIDRAREDGAARRGGDGTRIDLGDLSGAAGQTVDVVDLDAALDRLERVSERQARLVDLRVFCGLSRDEAAEVLSISPRTADDDWRMARTWLRARLGAARG